MLASSLATFCQVQARFVAEARAEAGWVSWVGLWPDEAAPEAAVLKLHRPHWSPDAREAAGNATGIFFSLWVDEAARARGGFHYNLHALKLRNLAGYALESRKFAAAFRARFQPLQGGWPVVRTDFGPQTLFQGFVVCAPERLEEAALALMWQFAPVGTVIDELLVLAVPVSADRSTPRPRRRPAAT